MFEGLIGNKIAPEIPQAGTLPSAPAIDRNIGLGTEAPAVLPSQDDGVGERISKALSGQTMEAKLSPTPFDWDKEQFGKFTQSPHFGTYGADPEAGAQFNEEKFAATQTGGDVFRRMAGGFIAGLGHGAWDQLTSWKNLLSVLSNIPDIGESYKQDQLEEINKKQQEFDNSWHIFSGENPSVWNKLARGLQESGHFLGAIAEIGVEAFTSQLLIAATFGAAAPLDTVEESRLLQMTTELFGDAEKANLVQNSAKLAESIDNPVTNNLWKTIGTKASQAGQYIPGIGNTVTFTGDVMRAGNVGGLMKTVGRGLGALTNDLRSINTAVSFASGNAAGTYQQIVQDETDRYKKEYGQDPGFADLQDIKDKALKSAKTDGAINAYAMLFLEKAAFGNILNSRGTLSDITNVERDVYGGIGKVPWYRMEAETAPLYVKNQINRQNLLSSMFNWASEKGNYGEIGKHAALTGAEFGAVSNAMSAIDNSVKAYYEATYDNHPISRLDAVRQGISSQFTKEGAGTFISGFLQGALLLGLGGAALGKGIKSLGEVYSKRGLTDEQNKAITDRQTADKTATQEFVNTFNTDWNNPFNPVKETFRGMASQQAAGEVMGMSSKEDVKSFHDIQDNATREFLLKMVKNGLGDMWVQRMEHYAQTLSPEELIKMVSDKLPVNEDTYNQIKNRIETLSGRLQDIKRIQKNIENIFGNPFDPWEKNSDGTYKHSTPEERGIVDNNRRLFDMAKDYVIMSHDVANRTLQRQNEILNGTTGTTGILDMPFGKNLDYSTVYAATSPNLLQGEMQNAAMEIQSATTELGKAAYTSKLNKIVAYKELLQKYIDERKEILKKPIQKGKTNLGELKALRDKYKDQLADKLHIWLESSTTLRNMDGKPIERRTPPTHAEVQDAMEKMMDYYDLGQEHEAVLRHINMIMDPALLKHLQMSFIIQGTDIEADKMKSLQEDENKLIAKLTKLHTPGEGKLTNHDKVIADTTAKLKEVQDELQGLYDKKGKNQKVRDWVPPTGDPENPIPEEEPTPEPKPDIPVQYSEEKLYNIKQDIIKYYTEPIEHHEGEGAEGIETEAPEYTKQVQEYLKTPDGMKLASKLSGYETLYTGKEDPGHKVLKSMIDKWFDHNVEPLKYPHLADSPEVKKVGEYQYKVGDKIYNSVMDANKALQDKYPKFSVQDREFQVGQYLYAPDGRKYILSEKNIIRKTPNGHPEAVTDEELLTYREKQPTPERVIPSMRLYNEHELTDIHPPGNELQQIEHQKVIDEVMRSIPRGEFDKNFTIQVSRNPENNKPISNKISDENPYIKFNREAYRIAIYRNGEDQPMFYINSPGKITFHIPGKGIQLVPDREDADLVLNPGNKTMDQRYDQFVADYKLSQMLAAIIDRNQGTLEHIGNELIIEVGRGEYEYLNKPDEIPLRPTIAATIDTGKELLAVHNRYSDETVYGDIPQGTQMPKLNTHLGNFTGLFRLRNGDTHWVEIATPVYEPEELNSLVEEYVDSSSKSIRDLYSQGKSEEAKNLAKLTSDKLSTIYITQNPNKDTVVTVTGMWMDSRDGWPRVAFRVDDNNGNEIHVPKFPLVIHGGFDAGTNKPYEKPVSFNGSGEEFTGRVQHELNNYLRKNNLPQVEIRPDNIRKSYPKGLIPRELIDQSKITTSTNIVKNLKPRLIGTRESSLVGDTVPTQGASPKTIDDIEKRRQGELSLAKDNNYRDVNKSNSVREIVKDINEYKYKISAVESFIENKNYPDSFKLSPSDIKDRKTEIATIQKKLLEVQNNLKDTKAAFEKDINTKYDAELKAFKQKPVVSDPLAELASMGQAGISGGEQAEEPDYTEPTPAEKLQSVGYTPLETEDAPPEDFMEGLDEMMVDNAVKPSEFDAQSVVDINQFIARVRDMFPEDSVHVQDLGHLELSLVQGNITVGQFITYIDRLSNGRKGVIRTYENAPYKYHEVLHAIQRLFLTPEQQQKLLEETHRINPATRQKIAAMPDEYKAGTYEEQKDRYQWEWMGDKFDAYMNGATPPHSNMIREFFRKLLLWAKEIWSRIKDNNIDALFYKADRNGFRKSKLQENDYTASSNEPNLKLIQVGTDMATDKNGNVVSIPRMLPLEDGERISSTLAALYHVEAKNTVHNKQQLVHSLIQRYSDMLYPKQQRYIDIYNKMYKGDPVSAGIWRKRLVDMWKVYSDPVAVKTLMENMDEHLRIMGYKQSLEDDTLSRREDREGSIAAFDDTVDQKGGYEYLPSDVREYIGSTIVPYTDEFGNSELTQGQPLYQAVDGQKIYNGLSQLLRNCLSYDDMIRKLQGAQYQGETGAVIRRLFDDTGFHVEQGIWSIAKNSILFSQFLNSFNLFTAGHPTVEYGGNIGTSRAYEANRQDGARIQIDAWAPAYNAVFLEGYTNTTAKKIYAKEHLKPINELISAIEKPVHYTESQTQQFVQDSQDISNRIKEQTGIAIHPLAIQYSIAHKTVDRISYMNELLSTYTADPIDVTDLRGIRDTAINGDNIFSEDGAVERLKRIANTNAIFDEHVDSTSYKDAEGNSRYGMMKPNYILERTKQINDDQYLQKLKDDKDYENNYLIDNQSFMAWDKQIGIVDGLSVRFHSEDEGDVSTPSYLDINRGPGIVSKQFGTRELDAYNLISYLNPDIAKGIYGTNVMSEIYSDKNTQYVTSMPVIHSVYLDKGSIRLTKSASDMLYAIVHDEISRIQRELQEVPGMAENEKVLGYQTGDVTRDGEMRAYKFNRSRHLLGEVNAKELEGILQRGEDIPRRFREIPLRSTIEKNILQSAKDYIDTDLKNSGLINPDGTNNLLPKALWEGLDDKKNTGLNLIKGNFDHNIAQIFVSNYLNATGINWLRKGNTAKLYKNPTDEVKRNAFLNSTGDSLGKPYSDETLGVYHPFDKFHIAILKEPKIDGNKIADSQSWCTEKGMRYLLFGSGTLTKIQAGILDKLGRGEEISAEEIFGAGGLIKNGGAFNSFKPVFYDGEHGLKMSTAMISRNDVTIDGEPDIANMERYHMWKAMKDYEDANQTVCIVLPESASKVVTKNIADSPDKITDSHWQQMDPHWLRKQTENPSNKLTITDSTQAKRQVLADQVDDIKVTVNGQETTIREVKQQYMEHTAQRVTNNMNNVINDLFSIKDGLLKLGQDINLQDITVTQGKLYDRLRENGIATGDNSQMLGFYETQNGQPVYDLNMPSTIEKYTQMVMKYFGDTMSEKVPGITATKKSDYGSLLPRRVIEVDDNGAPVPGKWEVIPRHEWVSNYQRYKQVAKTYSDNINRTFSGLRKGDIILDHLQVNIPEYENNKPTGLRYNEARMPAHHREDMGTVPKTLDKVYSNRIPYDDKNKGSYTRVVDSLPAAYGSIIEASDKESTAAGEDFDLDKRFIHIPDTYSNGRELVPYGHAITDKDKFEEYLMYQVNKNPAIKEQWDKLTKSPEWVTISLLDTERVALINLMKENRLPATEQEFMAAGGENLNNGVLNNKILQGKMALAANEHITGGDSPINLKPTDTSRLENVVNLFHDRFIQALETEQLTPDEKTALQGVINSLGDPDVDINSMSGISRTQAAISAGKGNVGVAANGVPSLSIVMQHGLSLSGEGISIDGKKYNSLGDTVDADGIRKFTQMMTDINAMTDNAKLRIAGKLGLNIAALSDAMSMSILGMLLVDRQLILLQPAVRQYYKDISILRGKLMTSTEERNSKNRILDKAIENLEKIGTKPAELRRDSMYDNIIHNGKDKSTELQALKTIQQITRISSGLFDIVNVMGMSGGLPNDWEGVDKIKESLEHLGIRLTNGEVYPTDPTVPFNPDDIHAILFDEDKIVATYIKVLATIDHLSPLLFTERNMLFRRLEDMVYSNFGYISNAMRGEFQKQLKNDLISALSIAAYKNDPNTDKSTIGQHLIYQSVPGESIIDVVNRVRKLTGKNANYFVNRFLRIVRADDPANKGKIDKAVSNNWARLSDNIQRKIRDSFTEGYTNPKTHKDFLAMFHYLLVKDGGQFKNGSYIKFLEPAIFKQLSDNMSRVTRSLALREFDDSTAMNMWSKDYTAMMNDIITAYGTHPDNIHYLREIKDKYNTTQPLSKTDEQLVKDGVDIETVRNHISSNSERPVKFTNDGRILIDMFRGVKNRDIQAGNQSTGDTNKKLNSTQKAIMEKNINYIKAAGFNTTKIDSGKQDKNGKPVMYTAIELPITIRSGRSLYRLAGTDKIHQSATPDQYIDKGENVPAGVRGVYVLTEPQGARNTFKLSGAVFGQPPVQSRLLDSTAPQPKEYNRVKNPGYSPVQDKTIDTEIKPQQQQDMSPEQGAIRTLGEQGITIGYVGDKWIAYKEGDVPMEIKGPEELLSHIRKQQPKQDIDLLDELASLSAIGGDMEDGEYYEDEPMPSQEPVVSSQPIDWKKEIEQLSTGKPEGWVDRAREMYTKGKRANMSDEQIMNKIKECL